ncbi:MAG TPA: hypothetical protein VFC93_00095 [Chloroflexota bacterium]|nr:hypothetical protein [Chloroflexota bacterium]
MRRTTITLPDELSDAIERLRRDQPVPAPLSGVVQAAIESTWRGGATARRSAVGVFASHQLPG